MAIAGVPKNRVGQVVQDSVDGGASEVTATQEGSGMTYTVTEGPSARSIQPPAALARKIAFLVNEKKNHEAHARRRAAKRRG